MPHGSYFKSHTSTFIITSVSSNGYHQTISPNYNIKEMWTKLQTEKPEQYQVLGGQKAL